jgi:hypothetical protein
MCKRVVAIVAILGGSLLVKADWGDAFRPEEKREDYSKPSRNAGFLTQEYETEEGEKRVGFKPVESIFGIERRERGDKENQYRRRHSRSHRYDRNDYNEDESED